MTQKTVNISSKAFCRNAMLIEDHAPADYAGRPILYSVKNTDRLASESSRARRIFLNKPDDKCSRDFTAYFKSSSKSGDPNYVASHTSPISLTRQNVVPTFAMSQSVRWNPYIEASSIEDVTHVERDPFHSRCRCTNCSTRNCPARISSSSTVRSGSIRNNIMTFADIYTMTPKCTDTACGSSIVPFFRVSEASASHCEIAVKDTHGNMYFDQPSNHIRCQPIPILKSTSRRCQDYIDTNTVENNYTECDHTTGRYQIPERDIYCHEPSRVSSIKSFFRSGRKKKERTNEEYHSKNRRIIYNEGISDVIADRCLTTPVRVPSEADERRPRGRACMRGRNGVNYCNEEENQIPHSQMANSRYHKNCKPKNTIFFYDNKEVCHIIPPPPKIRPKKAEYSEHLYQMPTCIKLPRKVLTSDVNIESYIDPKCKHRLGGALSNRWKQ